MTCSMGSGKNVCMFILLVRENCINHVINQRNFCHNSCTNPVQGLGKFPAMPLETFCMGPLYVSSFLLFIHLHRFNTV